MRFAKLSSHVLFVTVSRIGHVQLNFFKVNHFSHLQWSSRPPFCVRFIAGQIARVRCETHRVPRSHARAPEQRKRRGPPSDAPP